MPLVTIDYPAGQLSVGQKATLAEELTRVMLDIEGGGDTPFGRAGSLVRFCETPRDDWFIGGVNDATYVAGQALFLAAIYVPEGLLDRPRLSQAHEAATAAIARAAGAGDDQRRYIWVQIFEWPEGSLASGGVTASLFGIARRAGHPADHPVLAFPRAYFGAKDRLYAAHGFPQQMGGGARSTAIDGPALCRFGRPKRRLRAQDISVW